jgi:hypothetical protein
MPQARGLARALGLPGVQPRHSADHAEEARDVSPRKQRVRRSQGRSAKPVPLSRWAWVDGTGSRSR